MFQTRRSNLRKYVLVGGSVALTAAAAYQIYHSDAYGRSKRYLIRLRNALQKYIDALSTGGDIASSILVDLQRFLESDSNDMPSSLKQLAKILQSPEFTTTTTSTVTSIYRGVTNAQNQYTIEEAPPHPQSSSSTIDKILDALLSDRGHSLVSVAVSMAAKNMVSAYVETTARTSSTTDSTQQDNTDKLLAFLSTQQGQHLAVMAVAAFASNGMRVYMDKSLDVNFYEDLFSSMSRPEHLEAVKQCVSVFARDIVGAYLSTNNNNSNGDNSGGSDGDNRIALLQATRLLDDDITTINDTTTNNNQEDIEHHNNDDHDDNNTHTNNDDESMSPSGSTGSTNNNIITIASTSTTAADPTTTTTLALHDDLDSDSILHARTTTTTTTTTTKKKHQHHQQHTHINDNSNNNQWIAAVGKEVLNVSKDPAGRDAIAAVVSSATREVASVVTQSFTREMTMMLFVVVFVVGAVSAMMIHYMLRWMSGGAVIA